VLNDLPVTLTIVNLTLYVFSLIVLLELCRNIDAMLVQKSNSVSSILPFSPSTVDNLWHAGQELSDSSIAGVSAGN